MRFSVNLFYLQEMVFELIKTDIQNHFRSNGIVEHHASRKFRQSGQKKKR